MRPRPVIVILAIMISSVMGEASVAQSRRSYGQPQRHPAQSRQSRPDLRKEMAKLRFGKSSEKISAARALGDMGAAARSALPYLERLLKDDTTVCTQTFYRDSPLVLDSWATVSSEAYKAIRKIILDCKLKGLSYYSPPRTGGQKVDLGESMTLMQRAAQEQAALVQRAAEEHEALIAALESPSEDVRRTAALALAKLGDRRAATSLIEALRDKDADVLLRYEAIQGFCKLKDDRAIAVLIEVLEDENVGIRNAAASALMRITGQNFGQDRAKWEEWAEDHRRQASSG